ncbi:MAG: C40 family peptidase [Methylococcales bacterium]
MNFSLIEIFCFFVVRAALPVVIMLLVGCASTPVIDREVKAYPPVITYALSLQGVPYRWGKASPEEGFDCSGFVQHVYKKQGVFLPRTVGEMAATLPQVPKSQLHAGDLVIFNTIRNKASHVGLYIEDRKFIHAPSSRAGKVQVSSLENKYWSKRFIGVRRPTVLED